MNLEQWVKYSGELPTIWSISIITTVSVVFGYIAETIFNSITIGIIIGSIFAISGFLLVVLPNLIFIKRMLKDEQQSQNEVKQE